MTFIFFYHEYSVVGSEELPAGLASRVGGVSKTTTYDLDIVPEGQLKKSLAWYMEHLGPEMLDHVYVARHPDSRVIMSVREMCHAMGVG